MQQDLEARIREPHVREAFEILLLNMARFPEIVARYNVRGPKKSVHYLLGDTAPYAFIANADWLLWYFRRPGVTSGVFSYEEVMSEFPNAAFTFRDDEAKREVAIKVRQVSDAFDILSFVARHRNPLSQTW